MDKRVFRINRGISSCSLLEIRPLLSGISGAQLDADICCLKHVDKYIQSSLYMFGGIINEKNVSAELWSFHTVNNTWSLETPGHFDHYSVPYHAAGHTAHVVGNVMIIIFGARPKPRGGFAARM